MRITRYTLTLIIVILHVHSISWGFGLPGYMTMHGKVIDADTLEPIEGAIVYAGWMKCRPGIGSGSCKTGLVKEVLTDSDGEWELCGPRGTHYTSIFRSILGFIIPWLEPPVMGYYKPGYYPFRKKPGIGDFRAFAFTDESKGVEGVVLWRIEGRGELKRFLEQWRKDRCETLIPMRDAERRLRELDFDFRYSEDARRVYVPEDSLLYERYEVIGLKRAVTPEERRKARNMVPSMFTWNSKDLPLLTRALEERW